MNIEQTNLIEWIAHKPILLMSDFDMTLADTYVFSEKWQTHVPIMDRELIATLRRGSMELCIATARGALEPVSWMIGHTLLSEEIPLVVENGAALLWNRPSVSMEPSIELLVSDQEVQTLASLRHDLHSMISDIPGISKEHSLRLRSHRIASIELRAEHRDTHTGTPGDYPFVSTFMIETFPTIFDHCTITTTGSSLTIEPRSVNKKRGLMEALKRAHIDVNTIFPIGFGDNKNDTPIFSLAKEMGGIAIGVSKEVDESACDLLFEDGAHSTKRIIQHIQSNLL